MQAEPADRPWNAEPHITIHANGAIAPARRRRAVTCDAAPVAGHTDQAVSNRRARWNWIVNQFAGLAAPGDVRRFEAERVAPRRPAPGRSKPSFLERLRKRD